MLCSDGELNYIRAALAIAKGHSEVKPASIALH
jgi:hypothetical protein